jgi:cytochrome c oxidase subunit 3
VGLFSKLTEMPWLEQGLPEEGAQSGTFATSATKVSLIVFLAVVTSVFFLFFMAYIERMELFDWYPVEEPRVLWANTVLLILASFAMQSARKRAESLEKPIGLALMLGGLFAIAFLVGQYMAWGELQASGLYAVTNPASAFFYTLTGLHGVHLIGGLYVWARTVLRNKQGAERADIAHSVELCSVYWHYLLILWLALFTLMLNT